MTEFFLGAGGEVSVTKCFAKLLVFQRYVLLTLGAALSVICIVSSRAGADWERTIQITAVGDIMMGSTYPTPLLPPEDGQTLFLQVKDLLKRGDIVFGNLEGPLIEGGLPTKCGKTQNRPNMCFEFRMPTRYVRHLAETGFNVVNVANNHTLDFGADGLNNTLKILKAGGIVAAGGTRVATFTIRGKRVAVAGFSFSESFEWPSIVSVDKASQVITDIKKKNDILIVSFHGGSEGAGAQHTIDTSETLAGEMRGNVMKFARAAVDAGADLVIGHGPHVLRAIELYKGKLIAYSLGNFATYGHFNTRGPNGVSAILSIQLNETTGDFVIGQLFPVKLKEGGIPFLDEEQEAIRLVKELSVADVPSRLFLSDAGYLYPEHPPETIVQFDCLMNFLKRGYSLFSSRP
jgi:poly-gamma-glutamate capsule biosynthesis protein CapA/YwtB (metallophosphatase superfamily)